MPNKQHTNVHKSEDVLHSTYEGIFGVHKAQLQQATSAKPRSLTAHTSAAA
jgi:hypothetical protein